MICSEQIRALAARSTETRTRISDLVLKTPCLQSRSELSDIGRLFFKCENFQRTGSFKLRGAVSKLSEVPSDVSVITASSGNHGIACSHAASITGHKLTVVLPEDVAEAKLKKIEDYGTNTVLYPGDSGLAERHARSLAAEGGYVYVSPYNDAAVVAGQGTIALELLEQLPKIDNIYISMGGGGLISGIGSVFKTHSAETTVVGVSAVNSGALAESLAAGQVVDTKHFDTLADGCAGGMDHDSLTFPIAQEVVDRIVHCSEDMIASALRKLAWTEKMLVEGAAAMALAGYLQEAERVAGQTSVVVLCGANFDRRVLQPVLVQNE